MASVYIETTIPSYYFESRRQPSLVAWRDATRVWWDAHRHSYRLVTSQAVLSELSRAPEPKSSRSIELLKDVEVLREPTGILDVIEHYVEHKLMSPGGDGDAYHLAMASMCSIDYLLTWNCRHLANANKFQHIAILNERLHLHVPVLTTPLMLLPEDAT